MECWRLTLEKELERKMFICCKFCNLQFYAWVWSHQVIWSINYIQIKPVIPLWLSPIGSLCRWCQVPNKSHAIPPIHFFWKGKETPLETCQSNILVSFLICFLVMFFLVDIVIFQSPCLTTLYCYCTKDN